MKRVLFVDDQPRVLEQLQQMLESQKDQWDMAFAPGGEAALTLLDATPFDVVVSEIAMPGMDGAALLKIVCERNPAIVRIVLSAPQEMEEALRAVPVAHQFLLKPCDPNMLRVAVERATSLSNILSNKLLANLVGSVKDLPVLPRTYLALRQKLAEPEASIVDVVRIVEQDVAISAKILQLVNSAFFGLPREVSSVRTAVGFLGIDTLQNLVLSAGVFTIFDQLARLPGFSCEELQAHSQLTTKIAGQIPASAHVRGVAVVAGLLHDVGKLVLATRAPAHFTRALEGAEAEGRPLYVVETELMGVSHAEVGAYLLGIWGCRRRWWRQWRITIIRSACRRIPWTRWESCTFPIFWRTRLRVARRPANRWRRWKLIRSTWKDWASASSFPVGRKWRKRAPANCTWRARRGPPRA